LPATDAITIFFNTLGGAISVSIAQNIFANGLVKEVPKHTTGITGREILTIGATRGGRVVSISTHVAL
jgi:hypothetical protein